MVASLSTLTLNLLRHRFVKARLLLDLFDCWVSDRTFPIPLQWEAFCRLSNTSREWIGLCSLQERTSGTSIRYEDYTMVSGASRSCCDHQHCHHIDGRSSIGNTDDT